MRKRATIHWLQTVCLALLLGTACFIVRAQEQPQFPEELRDDPNLAREERLRLHLLRTEQMINARMAEEKKKAAEGGQKTIEEVQRLLSQTEPGVLRSAPPLIPTPTPTSPPPGIRLAVPTPPAAPGTHPNLPSPSPGVAAASGQVAFRVSRAIVYLHPFQSLSRVGDTFETEVRVHNVSGGPFDEIFLHLKYDPLVVAPERVNDSPIYKLLDSPPEFHVNRSKGELRYAARLRQAIARTTTTLLSIRWRALNPVFYSEINFVAGDEETRIGMGERNILGFVAGGRREGGLLSGNVIVAPRDDSPRKLLPPFGEIVVATINEFVILRLEADSESVKEGEEWDVTLALRNEATVPFNDVRVRVLFDPEKLQVMDWHRGNWIRQGVNIYDGFAHEDYPFDVFHANSADNERGEIVYHVGTRVAHIFPTGAFARIKFRALANASLNDVWFDFENPKSPKETVETDVSFLGSSVMFAPRREVETDQRPAPEPLRRPDT